MIDFMTWLWATKKIKAKDIHWYEITKLFEEYKRLIKEGAYEKEKRWQKRR